MQPSGPRDGHDPWLLREEPCKRDLGGCRLFLVREFVKQINQGLVRFTILRLKARDGIAEIRAIKLRVRANFAGEKTFPERAEWNESDAEFFESRYDFCLWT